MLGRKNQGKIKEKSRKIPGDNRGQEREREREQKKKKQKKLNKEPQDNTTKPTQPRCTDSEIETTN